MPDIFSPLENFFPEDDDVKIVELYLLNTKKQFGDLFKISDEDGKKWNLDDNRNSKIKNAATHLFFWSLLMNKIELAKLFWNMSEVSLLIFV